jgi:predicted enzyme related to lactoylglutathione lyase
MYVKERRMIKSLYPVLMVKDVAGMAAFYEEVFEMEKTFESDWYVSFKKETESGLFQMALLQFDHATHPPGLPGAGPGDSD